MSSPTLLTGKKILIIDDEELIREVASMMVEEEGGIPLQAEGPLKALEIIVGENLDCILCDFSMPEMTGVELFKKVREIRPEIPFIITSGLRMTPEVDQLRRQEELTFVPKPFQHADLMKIFQRVLNLKS